MTNFFSDLLQKYKFECARYRYHCGFNIFSSIPFSQFTLSGVIDNGTPHNEGQKGWKFFGQNLLNTPIESTKVERVGMHPAILTDVL